MWRRKREHGVAEIRLLEADIRKSGLCPLTMFLAFQEHRVVGSAASCLSS